MAELEFGPLADEDEEDALRDLLSQCFEFPKARWENYARQVGRENFRRVTRDGRVVAGLALLPIGQWFGGRSVPMGGIAAVGVPPEERGSGVAFELMRRTLEELREHGLPISCLYPATQRLYRKVGYEQAGTRCVFSAPGRAFPRFPRELPVRSFTPAGHEILHEAYQRFAARNPGSLERSEGMWTRATTAGDEPVYGYAVGAPPGVEGYVVFTQPKREGGGYRLAIRDWVATSPAALRTLCTVLSDHRSLAREVTWPGPLHDPRLALFEEQEAVYTQPERWMLRVVDVPKALEARGYPEGLEGEVHLDVKDDLLPGNEDRIVLRASAGRGKATPGGRGELKLHARALAGLYSGFYTPGQLEALGWLEGSPAAIAEATRLFAGPEPWMADAF